MKEFSKRTWTTLDDQGNEYKLSEKLKEAEDPEYSNDDNLSKLNNNKESKYEDSKENSEHEENEDKNGENEENEDDEDKDDEDKDDEDKDDEDKDDEDKDDEDNEDEDDEDEDDEDKDDEDEDDEDDEDEDKGKNEKDDDKKPDSDKRKELGPNRQSNDSKDPEGNSKDNFKKKALEKMQKEGPAKEAQEKIEKAKQQYENSKKVAKAIKSGIAKLGEILSNPITWVILGLIIFSIYFAAVFLVIGQNDYNKICSPSGVGGLNLGVDGDEDDFTRQAAIVEWMMSNPFDMMGGQPMTREQAIGIMGNMMQESYGANPRTIQNDHSMTRWQTCDNACVLSWGEVGGRAVGVLQWDGSRRPTFVKFAQSQGKQWHDLEVQMKFMMEELENPSDYNRGLLEGAGFHETTKTLEDYTRIWSEQYLRPGEPHMNKRIQFAQEFSAQFTGGGALPGGLATQCTTGIGVDTSNVVALAIESSWPNKNAPARHARCGSYTNCGIAESKPAYVEAKEIAQRETGADPLPTLFSSCDRFVATMYRASGADPEFPWGDSGTQGNYMKQSPKWQEISCQDRQPGDVLWRSGHIMLYVGMVDGQDSIASASYRERTGSLSATSCSGSQFIADGSPATGFRLSN